MRRGLALTAFTLAVLVAHLQLVGGRPNCDLTAYEAIRLGMTLAEVSAAVGVPPGDYMDGRHRVDAEEFSKYARQEFIPPARRETGWDWDWVGVRGRIYVNFDGEGKAWLKGYVPLTRGPGCVLFRSLEGLVDWLAG